MQVGRIAVVDDHGLVALALETLLAREADLEFARHDTSAAPVVRRPLDVDVVVLDLQLRDGSTPAANVEALRAWGAQVLVLTSGENPYLVREASQTGALGIVRKSAPSDVLLAALRSAVRGEQVLSTEWASAVDADPRMTSAPLTDRERQVLELYASGVGAKTVAAELFVSENTVNDHLRRIRSIYQQLGRPAGTKVELYQRGIEDGFVPPPSRG